MGMHALNLVCLLALGGNAPPDVTPMNLLAFDIPIQIDRARKAEIRELNLFVSTDQGRTWNKVAVATPEQTAFPYTAPRDGPYWFKIIVLDREGNPDPPSPYDGPPGLKVLIDTLKPELRITAVERHGDEVHVRWEIVDQTIDLASLRLLYRTPDAPSWSPVRVPAPSLVGQASFRPALPGPIVVRLEVQDLAQNPASAEAPVAASPSTTNYAPVAPPNNTAPPAPSAPPPWSPTQPVVLREQPRERADVSAAGTPGWHTPAGSGTVQIVATSDAQPSPAFTQQGSPAGAPPRTTRAPAAPLQMVNNNRVTLYYEVAKFGPSGVGSVELYVTRDEGRDWKPIGGAQNIAAPAPSELQAPATTMPRELTVELPEDGVYGFYLVVKSGAGLGKPPPAPGTPPQMRVQVDRTPPEAKLYAPEPAAGRRDALVLRWVATDHNLATNPITLQWAPPTPDRAGPASWQTIGGPELPNVGQFVWQVPPGVPPRVYLRLLVRDTAGNTGEAITQEPILIDLTEPEVQILRVGASSPR